MDTMPIGETHVVYVRYPSGAVGRIEQTAPVEALPAGGVEITQADYDDQRAELDAAHAARLAELAATDAANTLSDYRELRAAGVSDAGARRMSGYTGETPGDLS